jgi:hypothetical protein
MDNGQKWTNSHQRAPWEMDGRWTDKKKLMLETALEEEAYNEGSSTLWNKQAVEGEGDGKWVWEAHSPFVRWKERKGNERNMIEKFKPLRSSLTITIISTSSFEWGNGRRKFIKVYFDFTILYSWSFSFFVFY